MDWWTKNAKERAGDLLHWLGDNGAMSRAVFRDHIIRSGYHSMLDCGCGPGIDETGFAGMPYPMEYHGVDTCELFVEAARQRNLSVQLASVDGLPFGEGRVEVVYARHVLEHLAAPETALREMVRVASREVIVTFFIPPGTIDEVKLTVDGEAEIYHNRWSERRICVCLWEIEKVRRVWWRKVNDEMMMHVKVGD